MRSSSFFLPSLVVAGFLLLFACGDDDSGTTPIPDGGGTDSRIIGEDQAGPTDSGIDTRDAKPELRCTEAELDQGDVTDAGADAAALEITFNTGANPTQYTNNCLTVRAGTKVTFKGSFKQHPLEPAGGDEPSPIPMTDQDQPGNALVVDLPKAGTFGYQCTFHPLAMFGVIRVIP